jgi:hypothetical protein
MRPAFVLASLAPMLLASPLALAAPALAVMPEFQHKPKAPVDKVDLQLEDAEGAQVARPPLDMPVPQTPAGGSRPASTSPPAGGVSAPAKPTIIER